jgi:transposase InsO family protein
MAWFRRHGIRVRPVLTDNGAGYVSDRFARLCRSTGVRHLRTRPYTPRTNGKAERFIQTLFARMGLPPRLSPFAPPN